MTTRTRPTAERTQRDTLERERAESERPAASLPEQFGPPFGAMSSRRTFYSQTHFALWAMAPVLGVLAYVANTQLDSPAALAGLLLVHQGWLERRHGFGTVRVTFRSSGPASGDTASKRSRQRVDLERLDAPERLAQWLQEQSVRAKE